MHKLVYASSASVYGAAETFPTNEKHHPYDNRTLYGAAKLMNEGIARSFYQMYGLPSVGLRYFNVYGPRMDVTGAYTEVFIRWLECVERGRNMPSSQQYDGRFQCWVLLANDLIKSGCAHSGFLQLLERASRFDTLMLADIADQKHAVIGVNARKKLADLVRAGEA